MAHELKAHVREVDKKLSVLATYGDQLKSNQARVEVGERMISDGLKALEEFKQDDMFINSKSNYYELYQRLSA